MLRIDNILLPYDFSECSDRVIPYAVDLAERTGATLHMLYAVVVHGEWFQPADEPSPSTDRLRERLRQTTEERGADRYDADRIQIKHSVERDVAAAPAILTYADDHGMDVIVMGTHGRRGLRRAMLGSVAEEVVREAPCPVLTAGMHEEVRKPSVRRILVPSDFSEHAMQALRYARELAVFYDADLDLFHVVEETLHPAFYGPAVQSIYDAQPDIENRVREELEQTYRETAGPEPRGVRFLAGPGRAPRAIVRQAEAEGADLIVIATHGRTGPERFLMGSVAERVVRTSSCPVFTVKSFGKSLIAEGNAQATDARA